MLFLEEAQEKSQLALSICEEWLLKYTQPIINAAMLLVQEVKWLVF